MEYNKLLKEYTLKYCSKKELSYRLSSGINLEQFWKDLVAHRQARGEMLPFQDQEGLSFWFALTPPLQAMLHRIDSWGKDSLYEMVRAEIQQELIQQALIEEALCSSVIEGAFSTMARARELIVGGKRPRDTSDRMVMNNALVMRYVAEHRRDPCSVQLMHSLQQIVTQKTLEDEQMVGRFRNDLVYIYNAKGERIYTSPPAHTVEPSMQQLVDWINNEADYPFIHPILRAAIIHTWFVYVHPYVDGNGRTARSLYYWYLLKHDYDYFRYFSVSSIVQETRTQYYQALKDMETNGADMTYVLLYLTDAAVRAINVILQRISQRYRRDRLLEVIREQGILLSERQRKFLRRLTVASNQSGTIGKYQRDFDVVYETARRDLAQLETAGILKKHKQGRRYVYTLNPSFLLPPPT